MDYFGLQTRLTGRRGRGRRRRGRNSGGGGGGESKSKVWILVYMTLVCFLYKNFLGMIVRVCLEE